MSQKISLKDLVELFGKSAMDKELPGPIRAFAARLAVFVDYVGGLSAKLHAEIKARQELQARFDEVVSMIFKPIPDDANEAEDQVFREAQQQAMLSEVAKNNLENKLPEPVKQAPEDAPAVQALLGDPNLTPVAPNGSQQKQQSGVRGEQ